MPTYGEVYQKALQITNKQEAKAYLEKIVGDLIKNGMSPDAARITARANLVTFAFHCDPKLINELKLIYDLEAHI